MSRYRRSTCRSRRAGHQPGCAWLQQRFGLAYIFISHDLAVANGISPTASPYAPDWRPSEELKNGRLAVSFGFGAGNKYHQGTMDPKDGVDVFVDLFLSRGFAHLVASDLSTMCTATRCYRARR